MSFSEATQRLDRECVERHIGLVLIDTADADQPPYSRERIANITTRGETEMESVYGRKRMAADAGLRETWMGRFTQLEPEGGFGTVVRGSLNHSAPTAKGASLLKSLNGQLQTEPVYGQKYLSDAGVRETWMDLFTRLEPEGGFRLVVERAWSGTTPTSDQENNLAA
jgi:hypothetical protein